MRRQLFEAVLQTFFRDEPTVALGPGAVPRALHAVRSSADDPTVVPLSATKPLPAVSPVPMPVGHAAPGAAPPGVAKPAAPRNAADDPTAMADAVSDERLAEWRGARPPHAHAATPRGPSPRGTAPAGGQPVPPPVAARASNEAPRSPLTSPVFWLALGLGFALAFAVLRLTGVL